MGSMDYDDNGKKPRSEQQQHRRSRAVVLTNLSSILLFSGAGAALHAHIGRHYPAAAIHAWPWGSSKLLRELNVTGLALAASHAEVADLSSRLFERIGFEKVRWNAGRKLDRGVEMDEWHISALLRKPRR